MENEKLNNNSKGDNLTVSNTQDNGVDTLKIEQKDSNLSQEGAEPSDRKARESSKSSDKKNLQTTSLNDLLLNVIPTLAKNSTQQLKELIAGNFLIELVNSNTSSKYLFNFTQENFEVKQLKSGQTEVGESGLECSIKMTEKVFKEIISGDLNPQLGMLAGKIAVSGKVSLAVYFFNLFKE